MSRTSKIKYADEIEELKRTIKELNKQIKEFKRVIANNEKKISSLPNNDIKADVEPKNDKSKKFEPISERFLCPECGKKLESAKLGTRKLIRCVSCTYRVTLKDGVI